MVSKYILLEGLSQFYGANLVLNMKSTYGLSPLISQKSAYQVS